MSENEPITFSEAFAKSESLLPSELKTEKLMATRRRRYLIVSSMFLPTLEDNGVFDDADRQDLEVPVRFDEKVWNQLFMASSALYSGYPIQIK